MPFWIPLTVAAAFLQNARSALQKDLKTAIGAEGGGIGATFARFGYALPFAIVFFALASALEPVSLREAATPDWALWTTMGAVTQIGATWTLLRSFDFANFAVSTALNKTETLMTVLFGVIFLSEWPTGLAMLGILVSLPGAVALSVDPRAMKDRASQGQLRKAALWAIASAALLGVCVVGYRAASLSLDGGSVAFRACSTLLLTLILQSLLMGGWMLVYRPKAWTAVLRGWRPGLWIGATGAGASACWFLAMTLEPAAHVRALGQIELIFAIAAAALYFREPPSRREIVGIALIGVGAALLLAGSR